jgi:2-oxo-4-hydroxy-4-carboxy-5-ureidoimidazoline decarboxylase
MERWQEINAASPDQARAIFAACCGSTRWIERMVECRPFASNAAMHETARHAWFPLAPEDWLEAFSHHPRIGDRASLAARFPATHHLSEREQAGVGAAADDVLTALQEANDAYVERFGFIFIVCASGKTAEEMLRLLRDRLPNDRDTELRVAAEEQAKITAIRLG